VNIILSFRFKARKGLRFYQLGVLAILHGTADKLCWVRYSF